MLAEQSSLTMPRHEAHCARGRYRHQMHSSPLPHTHTPSTCLTNSCYTRFNSICFHVSGVDALFTESQHAPTPRLILYFKPSELTVVAQVTFTHLRSHTHTHTLSLPAVDHTWSLSSHTVLAVSFDTLTAVVADGG